MTFISGIEKTSWHSRRRSFKVLPLSFLLMSMGMWLSEKISRAVIQPSTVLVRLASASCSTHSIVRSHDRSRREFFQAFKRHSEAKLLLD